MQTYNRAKLRTQNRKEQNRTQNRTDASLSREKANPKK